MGGQVFYQSPPDELILRFLKVLGISGFADTHWWPRSLIRSAAPSLDLLLVEIEPYYTKHKKFHVLEEMNTSSYVVVLRHLIHCKGIELQSRYKPNKKYGTTMMYRIVPNCNDFVGDFNVSFDD